MVLYSMHTWQDAGVNFQVGEGEEEATGQSRGAATAEYA